MSEYDTPKILCRPCNARSYHTEKCQKVEESDDVRDASESLIEWHDLKHCEYCSGEWEPYRHGVEVAK